MNRHLIVSSYTRQSGLTNTYLMADYASRLARDKTHTQVMSQLTFGLPCYAIDRVVWRGESRFQEGIQSCRSCQQNAARLLFV